MFQIFRMQLGQMIGGQKKWLVVVFLVLPVLLTWVTMNFGGLGDLKQRLEARASGQIDPNVRGSARRVLSTGEPIELIGGRIVVLEDQVLVDGRRIPPYRTVTVDRRWIVIENGEVWVDPRHERKGRQPRIRFRDSGPFGNNFEPPWEMVVAIYLFLLYPQAICLLLALFYGSSLLGSELDNKTLTYLFTRPVARWRVVTGKYLAIVAALVVPTLVSLVVSWLLMGGGVSGSLLIGLVAGTVGAVLAYNALFILFGFLVPRRAMVVALLYGVVFEFFLSFVPALVNTATITYYLRSLVVEIAQLEVPRELARIVGGASMSASLLTLAGMIVLALTVSSTLASRREYAVTEQA